MAKPILTLTMNPTIDVFTAVEEVTPVHKLRCDAPQHDPGGGGINVARAIRRLGGAAVPLYISGGTTGQLLHKLLRREGIEDRRVETEKMTRESLTVQEKVTGGQFRFVFPGPEIRQREWQQCLDHLGLFTPVPAYMVASGSLPPGVPDDFYARAAKVARRVGSRLIVDTFGEPLKAAMTEKVFLIKPNLRELEGLLGRPLDDPAAEEEACRQLVARGGCEVVVLTLAGRGALLATRDRLLRATVPPVTVASTVGAGDSFVAGLTLSLSTGRSLEEALRFAAAAGTAAVMTPGTELCRREDTERLLEQVTVRPAP